jgi:hypothetical protein
MKKSRDSIPDAIEHKGSITMNQSYCYLLVALPLDDGLRISVVYCVHSIPKANASLTTKPVDNSIDG